RGEAEGWPNGLPADAVVKADELVATGRCWYEASASINGALLGCRHLWLRIEVENPSPGMECTVWIDGNRLAKQAIRLEPLAFSLEGTSVLDPSVDISHRFVLLFAGEPAPVTFKAWIEGCNHQIIHDLQVEPDPDNSCLRLTLKLSRKFGPGPHQLGYKIFNAISSDKRKAIISGTLPTTGWATIPFAKFKPWSLEDPQLYFLEVTIENAIGKREQASVRFGMRSVSLTVDGFYFNQKPLRLCAVALSQPGNRKEIRSRLEAVKDSGFNMVWLGTGLNHAAWTEAADELGILLVVEPPPALRFPFEAGSLRQDNLLASAREMIETCGNSPATIFWSANLDCQESPCSPLQGLMRESRRLDPSRAVVSGLAPGSDCPEGWILPAQSETLVKGGGVALFTPRPCDQARFRKYARLHPRFSPAWVVLTPVRPGFDDKLPPEWKERCRAGFDALEMPPEAGDFEQFLKEGEDLHQQSLAEILPVLHCNPHLSGIVIDGRKWNPEEEVEYLEKLRFANSDSLPIFFAPSLTLHEGEDEDFQIALPRQQLRKNARFNVSLTPEKHTVSVWRDEIKADVGGDTFAIITIPGKFLLPGRYQLVLEADWEEGGISELSVEVLPGSRWNNPNLKLIATDPAVALGLGFSDGKISWAQTALLSLGDSLLAHEPVELAETLARTEAGGTLFLLGTPQDTGKVLQATGILSRAFQVHSLGKNLRDKIPESQVSAPLYFGRTTSLFEELPAIGLMGSQWAESLPEHYLEASIGRLHTGIFCQDCAPPWGATILEIPLGKGRLLLTTFRWLGALGRDALTETLLAQLLESFPPKKRLAKVADARIIELAAKLEELRKSSRLWHIIGPFSLAANPSPQKQTQWEEDQGNVLAKSFPPEESIDFNSPVTGSEGRILRWRKYYTAVSKNTSPGKSAPPLGAMKIAAMFNELAVEPVIIAPLFMPMPDAAAYAVTRLTSKNKNMIPARLTTRHPARIYVNGELQLSFPGGCDQVINLKLGKGENLICIKTVGSNALEFATRADHCPLSPYQWGFLMEFGE
ncbi:MAG: hypothetical protein JXA52_03740, partial [Planctomycetes bacterium]|nr:hypothetical protein [Planctomycetota bacterium]